MNLGTKVEFSAFVLVMLQHFVLSDVEFFNKCPEFNPQNELDIELVSHDDRLAEGVEFLKAKRNFRNLH